MNGLVVPAGKAAPAMSALASDDRLRHVVHERVMAAVPPARRRSRDEVARVALEAAPLLSRPRLDAVVDAVLADISGLGPLDPLLADPLVDEVLVNGDGRVWVERAGALVPDGARLPAALVGHLIERIIAPLGLRLDRASPLVDARLPDGSRVNAVLPPLSPDGPCLAIRRFRRHALTLDDFAPSAVVALLAEAVQRRANVVVVGATSSGKTSLLNALAAAVPAEERVITVEDTAELRLPLEHVVRLEARPPNAEGTGAVTVRDLLRNALRMRPDRIVIGEARGAEAFDLVQAMNTGHDGALATCHANGTADAFRRLEALVLLAGVGLPVAAVREQLCAAVDLVVHVARGAGGRRRVVEVAEPAELPGPDGRPDLCRVADADGVVAPPRRRR
jgi:pilus assembly protein CpaF